MNELLIYIRIIKQLLDRDYGKSRVFYDSGDWYDRYHCRNLSLEELEDEVMEIAIRFEKESEYTNNLTEKIYELMGEEAENFLNSISK